MKIRLAFLSLVLAGCVHQSRAPHRGEGVFPYGTYKHSVTLEIVQPARKIEMKGVVSRTEDRIKAVGLSPFGATLFRIDENVKTGEIKKEFYLETMKQHEDRFMEYYKLIHTLLNAPAGSTDFMEGGAHFVLSDRDDEGIIRRIKIEQPQFQLDIRVTGYEL